MNSLGYFSEPMNFHKIYWLPHYQRKVISKFMTVLEEYFDSKPAVIAEKFKFHKRDQLPGE